MTEPLRAVQTSEDRKVWNTGSIMVCGGGGVGKTTLFGTLPGKKFAYLFDPEALSALPAGIDYIEFVPEAEEIAAAARTLRKEEDQPGGFDTDYGFKEPRTYINYDKDLSERLKQGFFEKYDWVMFDSATTWSEIMMDRIMYLAGRAGKTPEQADYTAEMNLMRSALRKVARTSRIYLTVHVEPRQDRLTKVVSDELILTGRNRLRIPLRFAHVLVVDADEDAAGNPTRSIVIQKSHDHPYVRTPLSRHPEMTTKKAVDVTINFTKPLEGQGLGRYFKL